MPYGAGPANRYGGSLFKGVRFKSSQASGIVNQSGGAKRLALGASEFFSTRFHEVGNYWEITNAVERLMTDRKRDLAAKMKEGIATHSQAPSVQSSAPGAGKKRNSNVAANLDPRYVGGAPRNRITGKGRSTAFADIIKPSYELQSGDLAERRLGSINGRAQSESVGTGSLFSRYNNKSLGPGLAGASASRLRGAKNLGAHPETWMKRYAAFWIASETSKAVQDWRGWDKVSFTMSNQAAKSAMGEPTPVSHLPIHLLGKGAEAGLGIVGMVSPFGTMLGAAMMGKSEQDAARANSLISAFGAWAGKGFKGPDPLQAIKLAEAEAVGAAGHAQFKAVEAATRQFHSNISDGLVRAKDTLAIRGVGGVFGVSGMGARLAERPDFQAQLDNMKAAARGSVDYNEILKDSFNKNIQNFK